MGRVRDGNEHGDVDGMGPWEDNLSFANRRIRPRRKAGWPEDEEIKAGKRDVGQNEGCNMMNHLSHNIIQHLVKNLAVIEKQVLLSLLRWHCC